MAFETVSKAGNPYFMGKAKIDFFPEALKIIFARSVAKFKGVRLAWD